MRLCYENAKTGTIVHNNTRLPERFSAEKMYEQFVSHVWAPTPAEMEWEKALSEIELA